MSRQGPPVGLIIVVVAVSAAGLLLWMILRTGEDGASANPAQPAASSRIVAGREAPPRAEDSGKPGAPRVVPSDSPRRSGEAEPPTETIIDGVRVRDHRRDRTQPIKSAGQGPPAHARRIPPELT